MSATTLPETAIPVAERDEFLPAPLPTQDELPYDDGEPLESQRHKWQMDLLIDVIEVWLRQRQDGYTNGNMFIYFSAAQTRGEHFRGPDFFAVLGVPKGERKSWVVWEEGKGPDVIIELLSESTAKYDKDEKKTVYQDQLRVPEYFWFDPFNPEDLAGFSLNSGAYKALQPDERGRLISQRLNLALVLWEGTYRGLEGRWLRWETLEGELLPTDAEAARQKAEQAEQWAEQEKQRAEQAEQWAEQEKQRAEQAEQWAEQEKQRAEQAEARLAQLQARLRALGFDADPE